MTITKMNNIAKEVQALAKAFKCVIAMSDTLDEIGDVERYRAELKASIDEHMAKVDGAKAARVLAERDLADVHLEVAQAHNDADAIVGNAKNQADDIIKAANERGADIVAAAQVSVNEFAAAARAAGAERRAAEAELLALRKSIEDAKATLQGMRDMAARLMQGG